jgi:adenylate cyclase
MQQRDIETLNAWLAEAGLQGMSEETLIRGFAERFVASGAPLVSGRVLVDTLHPLYEGRAFRWKLGDEEIVVNEYGSTSDGEALERWQSTPFYRMEANGDSLAVHRLDDPEISANAFMSLLQRENLTYVVALVDRFGEQGGIGPADCLYSAWGCDSAEGFREEDIEALRKLSPVLALALKAASLGRIAHTLVETYLGRDAGERVLKGRIARGVAEEIKTVLWFSDLRDYTRISDSAPPEQLIPMLNDYADAIVSAIHSQGGDVLKLIGDGVLAIFPAVDRQAACQAALAAAAKARAKVVKLNQTRTAASLPATNFYLGLHIGHVFYGNIGSRERLDFTVIGPAVNEVSRIASMCRSVDQALLMSFAFVEGLRQRRQDFLSVGRFALRGVAAAQELFTVDPAVWPQPVAEPLAKSDATG